MQQTKQRNPGPAGSAIEATGSASEVGGGGTRGYLFVGELNEANFAHQAAKLDGVMSVDRS